ncbi:hydrogenase maturation protease [Ectothiorhodospiraceae bacterium WFHF3C12]|nr:hydrogenase maturation protease [Ectothiorhodospiraceae bacterium WFHF3C12]
MVIGVGNLYRRDDGAGPLVARALRAGALPGLAVMEASGEGTALMEAWAGAQRAFLVDAVSSGARPGRVHRIDARRQRVPQDFFKYSTHAFAVAEAVEMARVLGDLPPVLIIYGIEGGDFGSGEGLTAEVAAAVDEVTRRIVEEAAAPVTSHGGEHA